MSAKQAIRNAQSPTPAWYTHEQRFEFPISIQVGDRFLKADLIKRLGNELVDRELPYQPYKPEGMFEQQVRRAKYKPQELVLTCRICRTSIRGTLSLNGSEVLITSVLREHVHGPSEQEKMRKRNEQLKIYKERYLQKRLALKEAEA